MWKLCNPIGISAIVLAYLQLLALGCDVQSSMSAKARDVRPLVEMSIRASVVVC